MWIKLKCMEGMQHSLQIHHIFSYFCYDSCFTTFSVVNEHFATLPRGAN